MAVKLFKGDRVRYAEDMAIIMAEFADGEGEVIERVSYEQVKVLWDNGDTVIENETDLELLDNPLKGKGK